MPSAARRVAVDVLSRVHTGDGYSGVVLDAALNRRPTLSEADRKLASRLVYGVVERRLTLDYALETHSTIKLKKLHPTVREILRVGCYQIVYMEKIPPSAAVNESVALARTMGQDRASGYVNAVLRAVLRDRDRLFGDLPSGDEGLSIRTSCPPELLKRWRSAYGEERTVLLAESANGVPPVFLRVNTLKLSTEEFLDLLHAQGIAADRHPFLPACLVLGEASGLKGLAQMFETCYYHQDAASQYDCMALEAKPGDRVADVCAAPGGKSLTIAQWMENRGKLFSGELHAGKCRTMAQRLRAMGASCAQTAVRDAAAPCPEYMIGAFDRVLCDAPCSGLGVIRRKPEIRYKTPDAELPALQSAILHESSKMVRVGGVLQYSTCTLNPAENEEVADRFLRDHPDFAPRTLPLNDCFAASDCPASHQITLFPPIHGTDGFYIAGFVRTR